MNIQIRKPNYKKLSEFITANNLKLVIDELNDGDYEAILSKEGGKVVATGFAWERKSLTNKSLLAQEALDSLVENFNRNKSLYPIYNFKLTLDADSFNFVE